MALTTEQLNAVKNKYLDGEGLAHLWEKIKTQITNESAKIIQVTGWTTTPPYTTTITDSEAKNLLTSTTQDVMLDDGGRRYYRAYWNGGTSWTWINGEDNTKIYKITLNVGSNYTLTKTEVAYHAATADSATNATNATNATYATNIGNSSGSLNYDTLKELDTNAVTTTNTLTTKKIVLGNGSKTVQSSSYGITTTLTSGDNANVPTSGAIASYVAGEVGKIDQFKYVISTEAANTPAGVTWYKEVNQSTTKIDGTLTPSASTEFIIYLVPMQDGSSTVDKNISGAYVEYLTVNTGTSSSPTYVWEKIGTTKTDLNDYVTKTQKATDSALGLVKIGYAQTEQNYPVQLNNNGQMYVNVPWENDDTKVTQTKSTSNGSFPLLFANINGSAMSTTTTVTDTTYWNSGISVNPNTSSLYTSGPITTGGTITARDKITVKGASTYPSIEIGPALDGMDGEPVIILREADGKYTTITNTAFHKTVSGTTYTINIPSKGGTLALTSDIKTYSAGNGLTLSASNAFSVKTLTTSDIDTICANAA